MHVPLRQGMTFQLWHHLCGDVTYTKQNQQPLLEGVRALGCGFCGFRGLGLRDTWSFLLSTSISTLIGVIITYKYSYLIL